MLIEKKLLECNWEFAQDYAVMIYNSIPPVRTRPGTFPRSPIKKFTGVKCDTSMLKVFGCRAFAHIDKLLWHKNYVAKAFQCVFGGIGQTSVKGYLLYSPEKNDIYVFTHVVFHPNYNYDVINMDLTQLRVPTCLYTVSNSTDIWRELTK